MGVSVVFVLDVASEVKVDGNRSPLLLRLVNQR
jgi:hypothetical protein